MELGARSRGVKGIRRYWAIGVIGSVFLARVAKGQEEGFRAFNLTAGTAAERAFIDACVAPAGGQISVRPLTPVVISRLLATCGLSEPKPAFEAAPFWGLVAINSARAPVETEGGVWRGRGVTVAASAGGVIRWRYLSASLRPVAFLSQNLAYRPSRSIVPAAGAFGSPWSDYIDDPYRFGPRAYGRLDWGHSYFRVDFSAVAFGVSNAAQIWGPARFQPLVLGTAAGGFPHVFLETGTPVNIGVGRISGRWIVGHLAASGFRPVSTSPDRLAVGAVGTLTPRGMPGLEIGGSRFFHVYDTPGVRNLSTVTLPFGGLLRSQLSLGGGPDAANQLASVFARFAPATAPLEAYAEFYREDHSVDLRDLLVEPDHNSAFMFGIRGRVNRGDVRRSITIEGSNGRISRIERVRAQSPSHTHGLIREGHTLRGLRLASPALAGGGGLVLVWESLSPQAQWTFTAGTLKRAHSGEGGSWNGEQTGYHTLGVARGFRRGREWYRAEALLQPGFGDIPGTNLSLSLALKR